MICFSYFYFFSVFFFISVLSYIFFSHFLRIFYLFSFLCTYLFYFISLLYLFSIHIFTYLFLILVFLQYENGFGGFICWQYFRAQPDDIGAWNNVGRTLAALNRTSDAELAWRTAKELLPKPRSGQQYQARIAPQHLNVLLNLGNIMAKDPKRLEEADLVYRQAISMRTDYVEAYINRGDVMLKMNRTLEAIEVYKQALEIDASNPDIYYNIAVVYTELRDVQQALDYFNKALNLNPDHSVIFCVSFHIFVFVLNISSSRFWILLFWWEKWRTRNCITLLNQGNQIWWWIFLKFKTKTRIRNIEDNGMIVSEDFLLLFVVYYFLYWYCIYCVIYLFIYLYLSVTNFFYALYFSIILLCWL